MVGSNLEPERKPVTDKEWGKLTPYAHLRRNTEMYFGSRDASLNRVLTFGSDGARCVEVEWTEAAFTAVREILDNAVDEVVAHGHGNKIEITYNPKTMVFSVSDNGRGIPIEWSEEEQCHAATVLLSHTLSGRNFVEDRGETRGLNGIGAKGVNFTSSWMDVEIDRGGENFQQRFEEGEDLVTHLPIIFPSHGKKTGTKISFKLSDAVFKTIKLPEKFIEDRIYEVAMCYPLVKVHYNGKLIKPKTVEQAIAPNIKPITFSIEAEGFKSKFWLFPNFLSDGTEFSTGMVNGIPVFHGGTHIDAFQRGFYSGLLAALTKESKKRKLNPNRSDLADGVLLYTQTEMKAPTFSSQAKTRMSRTDVANLVKKEMEQPDFYAKVIKSNPTWIEDVFARCAERTMKKDQSDLDKAARKAKREKVEDLEDACGLDRSKCVLFLCEGKSAVSGLTEARDAEWAGGLPLRGKIMNVWNMTPAEAMKNETIRHVCHAIGLVPGTRANRHMLRYGKVYCTTDADQDGANIAALLVNFFYKFWPELFDPTKPAFISIFSTPLIIATKGSKKTYFYEDNYSTFDPDNFKGWEITRAKGLAALKKDDWAYALKQPKEVKVYDDGRLQQTLELLFSADKADARKEWIGR